MIAFDAIDTQKAVTQIGNNIPITNL